MRYGRRYVYLVLQYGVDAWTLTEATTKITEAFKYGCFGDEVLKNGSRERFDEVH